MKIVRLEQDRIKVILSENDLDIMHMDLADIRPDSPELSNFLKVIIDVVKKETGFSITNGQVLVEASRFDGGLILLFSKSRRGTQRSRVRGLKMTKKDERTAFEFLGYEELIGLLINVDSEDIINMKLYKYLDSFYITILKNYIPPIIFEYSLKSQKSVIADSVLSEYGILLADGEQLSSLVSGLKKIN